MVVLVACRSPGWPALATDARAGTVADCMPHWISPDVGQVELLPGTYRIPAAAAPLLRATLLDHQVRGLLPYALLGRRDAGPCLLSGRSRCRKAGRPRASS